jgi:virginiamycin B lyase
MLDCTGCHTLERIVRSTHDADEWTQVITRMKGYAFVSTPLKPQRMLDETRAGKPEDYRKMAEYLATINLSAVDKWDYPVEDAAAPLRASDACHRDRIRYEASDDPAARRAAR